MQVTSVAHAIDIETGMVLTVVDRPTTLKMRYGMRFSLVGLTNFMTASQSVYKGNIVVHVC